MLQLTPDGQPDVHPPSAGFRRSALEVGAPECLAYSARPPSRGRRALSGSPAEGFVDAGLLVRRVAAVGDRRRGDRRGVPLGAIGALGRDMAARRLGVTGQRHGPARHQASDPAAAAVVAGRGALRRIRQGNSVLSR